MIHTRPLPLFFLLAAPMASAQGTILLDADTPSTGSNLETSSLVTVAGTVTYVGEVRATSDADFAAAGSVGDVFDIAAPNSDAILSFDFDVASVTFIYGGNSGVIDVEARDASGAVLDTFFQADTGTGQPAGPVTLNGPGIRSLYWTDPGFSYAALDNIELELGGGIGVNYCAAVPNSTGAIGTMSATGQTAAAANDLTLTASGLPPSQFGIFVVSRVQSFVPGAGGTSNGNLCLGGSLGRYSMPSQILSTGATGTFSLPIDLTAIPQGAGTVAAIAGDTWNFQAWHRDGVGLGSNFTDGLEVELQ